MDFAAFVLSQLAPASRVLEVGCGREGGVVSALLEAGHDVLAIDPDAPAGPRYRRVTLERFDGPDDFDAVVVGRALHHLEPLDPAVEKLAALAPMLIVDDFAWNHIDAETTRWYEDRRRTLIAEGREPKGPGVLAEWRARHSDLHRYEAMRAALDARYSERHFEWRPYFHRWLQDAATEPLEEDLIARGAIRPIGFLYVGVAR